jgi:uncharacterized protein (DUF433 family)
LYLRVESGASGSKSKHSRFYRTAARQLTGRVCILNVVKRGATVIEVDPAVLSGTPVFAGTRVPAQTLLEYLERGRSLAEFLADFPTVTQDQAIAALEEAKDAWLARARVPAESVIDLLDSWLEEDSKREGGAESWEQLKRGLDRDRLSSRPFFPRANSSFSPSATSNGKPRRTGVEERG